MSTTQQAIHDAVIADFTKKWRDTLSPDQFKAGLAMFDNNSQSSPATGSFISGLLYASISINAQFVGQYSGWGVGSCCCRRPFQGYVYCNSFSLLRSNTVCAYFWLALTYTSISFYSADGTNLGYFEGTSIGLVGAGGGAGGWTAF